MKKTLEDLEKEMADLTTHRINGYTAADGSYFACPLITKMAENLWQGGVPPIFLPEYFKFVVNLYPWEPYEVPKGVIQIVAPLYDSEKLAPTPVLNALADWINAVRMVGPVLVHCQAGLNRSALVTGLALIRRGMPPDAAIGMMREKRSPSVLCNPDFERYLRSLG